MRANYVPCDCSVGAVVFDSAVMFYSGTTEAFEGACGRSDSQSGKPYMTNWQPITSLSFCLLLKETLAHINGEEPQTRRSKSLRDKYWEKTLCSFLLTTNKLVYCKVMLVQRRQTNTAFKYRRGNMYEEGGGLFQGLFRWITCAAQTGTDR